MAPDIAPRATFLSLVVADPDRARDFYVRVGLTVRSTDPVVLDAGGLRVALVQGDTLAALGARPGGAPGAAALSLNVDDANTVDAILDRLPDARVDRAPHTPPWGGRAAWIRDPDGHLLELVYNPRLR